MGNIFWKTYKEGYFMPQKIKVRSCMCKRLPGAVVWVDSVENPICPQCNLPLPIPDPILTGGHMTLSEFEVFYNQMVEVEKKLLSSKGIEYSGKEDRFNNFNKLGIELNLSPEKILWIYLKKHLDGILSYINGEYVGGEPIIGRINDARNYLALLAGMIVAKGGSK